MFKFFKTLGIYLSLLAIVCPMAEIFAQGRLITGTVTSSENKQPAQGVSVTVKGTRTGTVTDAQGNYRLTVDNGATTLVFSSTSFATYEVAIGTSTMINAELTPDVKAIE